MDLSIIIVNYNTKELLKRCLESVIRDTRYVIRNTEIVVVDNGSIDGSQKMVEEFDRKHSCQFASGTGGLQGKKKVRVPPIRENLRKPTVKLIANRTNQGFAKANNQALRQAQGEYILLLNSDTEVKPGALEKLVEFAQNHPEAGVVGPRLINADSSIQPSVYHFPTLIRAIREYWLGQKGVYEKYAPKSKKAVEIEAVVGAAMLIPKKVLEEVGLLNERYFMYFEDLDFCRRVKRAGLKVFYLPTAKIIHHHGASGKEIPFKTRRWLVQSSKIYHGALKYYLINFIIWSSQKWQRLIKRK